MLLLTLMPDCKTNLKERLTSPYTSVYGLSYCRDKRSLQMRYATINANARLQDQFKGATSAALRQLCSPCGERYKRDVCFSTKGIRLTASCGRIQYIKFGTKKRDKSGYMLVIAYLSFIFFGRMFFGKTP